MKTPDRLTQSAFHISDIGRFLKLPLSSLLGCDYHSRWIQWMRLTCLFVNFKVSGFGFNIKVRERRMKKRRHAERIITMLAYLDHYCQQVHGSKTHTQNTCTASDLPPRIMKKYFPLELFPGLEIK